MYIFFLLFSWMLLYVPVNAMDKEGLIFDIERFKKIQNNFDELNTEGERVFLFAANKKEKKTDLDYVKGTNIFCKIVPPQNSCVDLSPKMQDFLRGLTTENCRREYKRFVTQENVDKVVQTADFLGLKEEVLDELYYNVHSYSRVKFEQFTKDLLDGYKFLCVVPVAIQRKEGKKVFSHKAMVYHNFEIKKVEKKMKAVCADQNIKTLKTFGLKNIARKIRNEIVLIDLKKNNISEIYKKDIEKLKKIFPNLRGLDLAGNDIAFIEPGAFSCLAGLKQGHITLNKGVQYINNMTPIWWRNDQEKWHNIRQALVFPLLNGFDRSNAWLNKLCISRQVIEYCLPWAHDGIRKLCVVFIAGTLASLKAIIVNQIFDFTILTPESFELISNHKLYLVVGLHDVLRINWQATSWYNRKFPDHIKSFLEPEIWHV
ncbi:MAG TPA: hypothetical protein VEK38_01210 [Candidatus Bathyarchaeia archaeon]|nr:hypothetical protein [Candidatus Bathyarchaeia archaeon]